MAKTTKKKINIQRLETLGLLLEKIEVLNSFKRKNKGTKVSLFTTIKEARAKVEELKENL